MRIVCLVGIWDFPRNGGMWKRFVKALGQQFPNAEIVVERRFFHPWQSRLIQDYADDVVRQYDDGIPLVLLGYSLGGVVAQAVAERFIKSSVLACVSVCAPLQLAFWWGFMWRQDVLQGRRVSVVGWFDPVVWWPLGMATGVRVVGLKADHLVGFVLFDGGPKKVAALVKDVVK